MFELNNYSINEYKNKKKFNGLGNIFKFLIKTLSNFLIFIFFIFIIFIGLIFKLFRKDFLKKKIDKNNNSYWENRIN